MTASADSVPGISSIERQILTPLLIRRLAAVLDVDADVTVTAGIVPPLWHWAFFTDVVRQSELGRDGHPDRRLHPIADDDVDAFPRRMFAGGRLEIRTPLNIGATAERASRLADVRLKESRGRRLRFVTFRDDITDDHGGHVIEERDLVYLGGEPLPPNGTEGEAEPSRTVLEDAPSPPAAPWREEFEPDPVLLFRFSAVTFNAHRIHYDRSYATGDEGYPDLVVHGPLLAMRLCELGRRSAAGRVRAFSFRARQPVFVGETAMLRGWPDGSSADMAAFSRGSRPAMTASVKFEDISGATSAQPASRSCGQ